MPKTKIKLNQRYVDTLLFSWYNIPVEACGKYNCTVEINFYERRRVMFYSNKIGYFSFASWVSYSL